MSRSSFTGLLLIFVIVAIWIFFVRPRFIEISRDFSYEATVVSHDNFYDEELGEFSGEQRSATKFLYRVEEVIDEVLIIKNVFDVRTLAGEKIFSVERHYGVDARTGKHVSGYGDSDRSGYLFAPRNLKRGESFTYWHINYDGPAHMEFVGEEILEGLTVYHYESRYGGVDIDQTEDLTFLPGVGTSLGVNLDPYLQLWVEPTTGRLINYSDRTTAYFYDLQTKERLHPWNTFSNTFERASIVAQVQIAKQTKLLLLVLDIAVFVVAVFIGLVFLFWRLWLNARRAQKQSLETLDELEKSRKEIREKLEEREALNKIMVGRELKMIELKRELNKYKRSIDKK